MCYYMCMPDEERKVLPEVGFSPETVEPFENGEASPDLLISDTEGSQRETAVVERPPVVPSVEHVPNNVVELRPQKDPLFEAVEDILERELRPLYDAMPKAKQDLFRAVADRTTQKIRDDIAAGKLNRHRTMKWIGEWLSVIPQVNRYWIGQERKNRTDDLFDLQEREQRKAA